jgi:hypothetical protein
MLHNQTTPAAPFRPRANLPKTSKPQQTPVRIAFDKFAAAFAASKAAATTDADLGTLRDATPAQKAAARTWERLLQRADAAAAKVVVAPAKSIDDMLLKIKAASFVMECMQISRGDDYAVTDLVMTGEFSRAELVEHFGGIKIEDSLIVALRDDLRTMQRSA